MYVNEIGGKIIGFYIGSLINFNHFISKKDAESRGGFFCSTPPGSVAWAEPDPWVSPMATQIGLLRSPLG